MHLDIGLQHSGQMDFVIDFHMIGGRRFLTWVNETRKLYTCHKSHCDLSTCIDVFRGHFMLNVCCNMLMVESNIIYWNTYSFKKHICKGCEMESTCTCTCTCKQMWMLRLTHIGICCCAKMHYVLSILN